MADIIVNSPQLQEAGGQINACAVEIETAINRIGQIVGSLEWRGQSQAQAAALWAELQAGAQQIQQALAGYALLTGQAGSSFQESDTTIAQTFRR
jgi:WXG100 family type VII secretion target